MRHQLKVEGRTLSYLESGTRPNVLVLLHAFPMSAAMWRPQLDALSESFRVIAPDLRGFGWSEWLSDENRNLSMDDYARDVLALLDSIGVRQVVVCGLSMGGYAALALVRIAPERLSGLVLANTKAEPDSEEGRKGRAEMLAFIDRERNINGDKAVVDIVDQMVPKLLSEKTRRERPDIEQFVRDVGSTNNIIGIHDAVVRMMNRQDSTPLLSGISCPTLVIGSDHDAVMPVDQMQAMQQRIPGSRLAVIPDAGHLSNIEQPDEFNEAIRKFPAWI